MFIRNIPSFVSDFIAAAQSFAYMPPEGCKLETCEVNLTQLAAQCKQEGLSGFIIGMHTESHGVILEIKSLEECYADLMTLDKIPLNHPCMIVQLSQEVLNPAIEMTLIHGYSSVVQACMFQENEGLRNLDNTKELTGYLYSAIYSYMESRRKMEADNRERQIQKSNRANSQYFSKYSPHNREYKM